MIYSVLSFPIDENSVIFYRINIEQQIIRIENNLEIY